MSSETVPWLVFSLVSVSIAFLHHRLTGHVGFNATDEGFLWYGVRQTRRGAVPIRDFKAYEPGRYYLLAGLGTVFGDGIVGLRKSLEVVRALGLGLAMLLVWLATHDMIWTLATATLVQIWYFPSWKALDIAWSLAQVLVASRLLDSPDPRTLTLSGMWIAASWIVGLNHALYAGAIGVLSLVVGSVAHRGSLADVLTLGLGAVLGCAIVVGLASLVPGFLRACYRDRIRAILSRRRANLRLPLPRLSFWRVPLSRLAPAIVFWLIPGVLVGVICLFVLVPSGESAPGSWAAASAIVGLVYCHVAWSRADLPHLAQSLHPFIVASAIVVAPTGWPGWLAFGVLCGLSIMARKDSAFQWLSLRRTPAEFSPLCFQGETTWLPGEQARRIREIEALVTRHTSPGDAVLIAPLDTGLYPLLGRTTPVYEAFSVFPATLALQERMIREMRTQNVSLVVVDDRALDSLESRRFSANHPLVWSYLRREFRELPRGVLGGEYVAFHQARRSDEPIDADPDLETEG